MKRGMFLPLYFFLLILFAGSIPAYAVEGLTGSNHDGSAQQIVKPGKARDYKEGEVLVKFKRGVSDQRKKDGHKKHHAKRIKEFKHLDIDHVQLDPGVSAEEAIVRYKADPDVVYAEPNYRVHALDAPPQQFPSDALFNQLWGLYNTGQTGGKAGADIKAPAAWGITTGSSTVVVAVIDTGIDYTHVDLAANMWVNTAEIANNGIDDDGDGYTDDVYGINAITGTGNPMDDMGHGTHVAGIIGAVGNNAIGVAGVNWNVKMVGCKFLSAGGSGYESDAVTCLEYVRDLKARGVNIVATSNSWGGGDYSQALHDAIQAQMEDNILFIAAAGNQNSDNDLYVNYPSNFDVPNILSVAATDGSDKRAVFSNYGRHTVHVAAPGVNILSTLPAQNYWNIAGGYGQLSGTSMATPHVTGLAALLMSQNPSWTFDKVLAQIVGTADATGDQTIGAGRINAYRALSETISTTRLVQYSRSITEVTGNNNGRIDAGETINFVVELRNMAAPVQGVWATLSTADPYVTISGGTAFYGDMASWSKAANTASPFVVSISPEAPQIHKITFTLEITANSGAYSALESFEERVSLYLPGWPVTLTGTKVESHPVLADVDHDGLPEVIIASDKVYVIKGDGSILPGWPQPPGSWTSPAVGDIDNDGRMEIVLASFDKIYAWKDDGSLMPGFPLAPSVPQTNYPYFGEVSLADLDADGTLEILVAEHDSGQVYAFRYDGSSLPGWPVSTGDTIASSSATPAVGDINNDGFLEVVIGTMGKRVFAWNHDGSLVTGWPVTTPSQMAMPATIGDVDNDGIPEIFIGSYGSDDYLLYAFKGTGAALPGWPKPGSVAALGDINKDGYLEIVTGYRAYRYDGTLLPGWVGGADPYWTSSLADIDNDGTIEVVMRNTNNEIYAFHADGTAVAEFPLKLGYSRPAVYSSVALGDINGDGILDMVTGSSGGGANVYAIALPLASSAEVLWPMHQHDAQHTGTIEKMWFVTRSLRHGKVGTFYSQTLQAAGGEPPYTWAIASGSLPEGMTLNTVTGEISGTSITAGTSIVTFRVADSRSLTKIKAFPLAIDDPLTITTSALNPGAVGAAYSQTLAATGGAKPYSWFVVTGSLPAGLTLQSATGVISGTPTGGGTSSFTVQVTDVSSRTSTQQLSINVRYVITTTLPDGNGTVSPSGTVYVDSGGGQTYTFTPNPGYRIYDVRVDGVSVGIAATYTFTAIAANHIMKVYFDTVIYGLTVTKAGTGSGTVTSAPSVVINCGTSCIAGGTLLDTYILTATPDAGSTFTGWSGACSGTGTCPVTMNGNKTVTATFSRPDSITAAVPNGGEAWKRGSTYTIRWNYNGNPGANVKIELLKGGLVNRTITSSTTVGSSGSGSYSWKISTSQAKGSDYKIRVTSTSNSTYTDTSNANFAIQ